jgi:hypothetical protein
MRAFLSCLPALLAALLIAVSPGCASSPELALPPGAQRLVERPRHVHVPTSPDDVSGIERGAGQWDPPNVSGDGWAALFLLAVYGVVYVGYAIGWCFVALGELIYESFESNPDEDEADSDPATEKPAEEVDEEPE